MVGALADDGGLSAAAVPFGKPHRRGSFAIQPSAEVFSAKNSPEGNEKLGDVYSLERFSRGQTDIVEVTQPPTTLVHVVAWRQCARLFHQRLLGGLDRERERGLVAFKLPPDALNAVELAHEDGSGCQG